MTKYRCQLSVTSNLCLKTNDSVISTFIQEYGAWEEDKVTDVMRAMEMYQEAVFIGTYNAPT